jgi:hypothetical protein
LCKSATTAKQALIGGIDNGIGINVNTHHSILKVSFMPLWISFC